MLVNTEYGIIISVTTKKSKLQYILEFYLTIGIPLVYLINLYFITHVNTVLFPLSLRVIGLGLSFSGLLIWVMSYIDLGKSFGVLPQIQERITKGIYQYYKHPMYLGIMATFLGIAIAVQSKAGVSVTILILAPLLMIRAHFEDKQLK